MACPLSEIEGYASVALYLTMVQLRGPDDICRVEKRVLNAFSGISERHISESLDHLMAGGWISQVSVGDDIIHYQVSLDPIERLKVPYPRRES